MQGTNTSGLPLTVPRPVPPPLPPRSLPVRPSVPRGRSPSPTPSSSNSQMTDSLSCGKDTNHLTPEAQLPSPVPDHENAYLHDAPPKYEEHWAGREPGDPRSSSMHSLLPADSNGDGRRRLLLVYIHGFMGNETSFRSFPAHVHNLLTVSLADTHVVHTKIYPRYKSRKAIDYARDDFSNWYRLLCQLFGVCLQGQACAPRIFNNRCGIGRS